MILDQGRPRPYKRLTSTFKITTVLCWNLSRSQMSSLHGVRPVHPASLHSCLANKNTKTLPIDMSPLSAEYRSSATDSDSELDNNEDEKDKVTARGHRAAPGRSKPGGLTVTQELLAAFTASLDAHKVCLRFFAGSWESLREVLPHQGRLPYDIVLASETIYCTETLDAFVGVLRTATATPAPAVPVADAASLGDQEVEWPLCLVAAKVLYFGVGGNVQGFVHVVEREHGTVCTMWECLEGVGRIIMRVKW